MTDPQSPIVVNQTVANEIRALREQQEALYFRDKAVLGDDFVSKRKNKRGKSEDRINAIALENITDLALSVHRAEKAKSLPTSITCPGTDILQMVVIFGIICLGTFLIAALLELCVKITLFVYSLFLILG